MTLSRTLPALAKAEAVVARRDDNSFVLRSPQPLRQPAPTLGSWLSQWARDKPDALLLAERDGAGWRRLNWHDAYAQARAIAQALIDRELSLARPLLILSGNSIGHALMMFGGWLAGVPVVPVSEAYCLRSADHAQLSHIFDLVTPGLVYVERQAPFAPALRKLALSASERQQPLPEIIVGQPEPGASPQLAVTPLGELCSALAGARLDLAAARVGPDTVAKILMTSGSTGRPKGVLNTHRMLTANQEQLAQVWPFVDDEPPVLVDWLPWSHTFGGNHNLNLVLRTGGTMYIDGGRPAPGLFAETLRNLSEIAPTIQFNVPAGYAMLAQALEQDQALAEHFFSRLSAIFYAAAALPQDTWQRLDALAERTLNRRVWLTTAWGSTETSPLVTSAHFASDQAGNIGLPVPGCELKFVPSGSKLEMRVRGPNVTPGYHRDPERTAAAFDDEGYYRIGDAGKLLDPDDPARGVLFDGRVSEDFKLYTGTWVNAGSVRTEALSAAAGLLAHAVVAGHDREDVRLLAWLDPTAASQLSDPRTPRAEWVTDARIHATLRQRLTAYNQRVGGSSRRVAAILLLSAPPDLDAGEITDKGYLNAAAVLAHRRAELLRLYAAPAAPDVVELNA